jgi:DNA polymerase
MGKVSRDKKSPYGLDYLYGAKITENYVQAYARDIIAWQIYVLHKQLGYKVAMTVHDEIILCVPEAQAKQAEIDLLRVMRTAPPWAPGLPLNAECGVAERYGDC